MPHHYLKFSVPLRTPLEVLRAYPIRTRLRSDARSATKIRRPLTATPTAPPSVHDRLIRSEAIATALRMIMALSPPLGNQETHPFARLCHGHGRGIADLCTWPHRRHEVPPPEDRAEPSVGFRREFESLARRQGAIIDGRLDHGRILPCVEVSADPVLEATAVPQGAVRRSALVYALDVHVPSRPVIGREEMPREGWRDGARAVPQRTLCATRHQHQRGSERGGGPPRIREVRPVGSRRRHTA